MSRSIEVKNRTSLNSFERSALGADGKLLFTSWQGHRGAFLVRDHKLTAVSIFPEHASPVGSVHIGRVKNAVQELNAWFVELCMPEGERTNCFLSAAEGAYPYLLNRSYDGRILEGDEILVQVIREAQKTKQPAVTTRLSIADPYFVLCIGSERVGYSTKLSEETKTAMKACLEAAGLVRDGKLVCGIPHTGLVVRTRAAELVDGTGKTLAERLQLRLEQWETFFREASHRTCYSLLRPAPSAWETVLDHQVVAGEYEEAVTDDPALYEELLRSGRFRPAEAKTASVSITDGMPGLKPLRLYSDPAWPLAGLYRLDTLMDEALQRRVWLRSGGYLVIDVTEAMVVIDVNSGKCESGRAQQEVSAAVNREAAAEIARQMRLRSLSGMILIDFINMKSEAERTALLSYMKELVRTDPTPVQVIDFTALGLMELTRKKGAPMLREQLGR